MEEIEEDFFSLLLICLAIAIVFASALLIYKINCCKASIISFIFAWLFLIAYFFQPFLVSLDYLVFQYETSRSRERNYERIDKAFTLIYKIVGWVGTGFNLFLLPIFKNFYFSGYFTFGEKLCDALKRFFRDDLFPFYILAIPFVIILTIGLIYYFLEKELVLSSADLALNCAIIPGFLKCLLYIGSYIPIVVCELHFAFDCCCRTRDKYKNVLTGVILYYLNEDKNKFIEAFKKVIKMKEKVYLTEEQKKQINALIEECKKCQDEGGSYFIQKFDTDNKDLKNLSKSIEKAEYNLFFNSITKINEVILTIPRKVYVYINIKNKFDKVYGLWYFFYMLFMIGIGIFVFYVECFGNYFNYSESKDDYNRITIKKPLLLFIHLIFYHIVVYFSLLKRNSITNQMLYGKRDSDTLCLLNFATAISGLISPVSFVVIYSKYFGIFDYDEPYEKLENNTFYPHNNMVFTKTYKYILIDNLKPLFHLDITFKETFYIYVVIKSCIIIFFFLGTFLFHSILIQFGCCCPEKTCCKKKCKNIKFEYIFNDKNEKCCASCRKNTFSIIGETGELPEEDELEIFEELTEAS